MYLQVEDEHHGERVGAQAASVDVLEAPHVKVGLHEENLNERGK